MPATAAPGPSSGSVKPSPGSVKPSSGSVKPSPGSVKPSSGSVSSSARVYREIALSRSPAAKAALPRRLRSAMGATGAGATVGATASARPNTEGSAQSAPPPWTAA
eukprot:scaffold24119_cov67-Isochrysis_galbana.AAC.1